MSNAINLLNMGEERERRFRCLVYFVYMVGGKWWLKEGVNKSTTKNNYIKNVGNGGLFLKIKKYRDGNDLQMLVIYYNIQAFPFFGN